MFPRYRFNHALTETSKEETFLAQPNKQSPNEKYPKTKPTSITSHEDHDHDHEPGTITLPPRTYRQKLALVHSFPDDKTTWFQYFRRPFNLFLFPNIVLAGIQFAFGCTAGIVSFNTISEIMTESPYNWSAGSAGLLFLAALVGNFIGYHFPLLPPFLF